MAARRSGSAPRWLLPSALLLLAAFLLLAPPPALALRFDLESGHTKCISDEIKVGAMAVGKYHVVGPDPNFPDAQLPESHRISLRVTSPYGNSMHYAENVQSGHFAFTAAEAGDYLACFWAPDHKPPVTIGFEFDWRSGVSAKDWPSVAKKGKVDGPGTKPVVRHGTFSKSEFTEMMEEHKHQELRQLRSDTSLELGCDARGHSRAGNDTAIWYCVVVAGRPGAALSKKRQVLRKAQDQLIGAVDTSATGNVDNSVEISSAATALKDNRLTFVWLDGEVQKQICAFYLATDYNGACGPRGFGDDNDKPELFIVRFQRNATYEALKAEKRNNLMEAIQGQHGSDASQLVARYKGPDEIQEINKWVSQIIKDGDTREIPYFTSKVPDLVPEETSKEWLRTTKSIRNNQPNQNARQHASKDKAPKDKTKRPRPKLSSSLFGQPSDSITDVEPKDARQWEMTDSDSD
ncbi:hypothetical protein PR202_ga29068 [Eleusine coracana subsp. coracana]|uniref:GOLD domain-containing protein n=1 Tax=Eleusine coracana subsp. coracana TaxID=191504 RepID=A0AAV5DL39_ELECO|nr:hypothetical protein PR202_ga29068 [Eleusine coracana subsp. coracana]